MEVVHCRNCTRLDDENILFLNVDAIEESLPPAYTVGIALRNEDSDPNEPSKQWKRVR